MGTVFKVTLAGTLTTLHTFNGIDGYDSCTVSDHERILYGTTDQGGENSGGTIFSLSTGLGPFVKTLPASGKVGATVKILGTNLTDATSISSQRHCRGIHGCLGFADHDHRPHRCDHRYISDYDPGTC